jgi:hypothetical protein
MNGSTKTVKRAKSNVPTYRAWIRRSPDIIAPQPSDIVYDGLPNGNLIGELPCGARPLPKGECGTLDRTDGGDPFERALFTSPSGRIYVVERST